MGQKGKTQDGRTSDLTFSWMLTSLGAEWQQWQELAAEWMMAQNGDIDTKLVALSRFLNHMFWNTHPTQSMYRYF